MIEALKGEEIVYKVGGRFKLTALIQHRVRELMEGARPLVDRKGRSDIEVAIEEIQQGKLTLELGKPDAPAPRKHMTSAVPASDE